MTSPCLRCARVLGRSCCQVTDGEALATLTHADIRRITDATGTPAKAFVEEEWLTLPAAAAYETRRPLYAGYFRTSPRRLTLQRAKGACVFFRDGSGCSLTAETRPSACRLYPFDVSPAGNLALQVDRFPSQEEARAEGGGCLAVQEASGFRALQRAFDTTEESVRALGARVREEVKAHAAEEASVADERKRAELALKPSKPGRVARPSSPRRKRR